MFIKYVQFCSVLISAPIQKICAGAFTDCENLKKITINANDLKSVGAKSFKGISSKATITIICKDKKTYDNAVKMIKKAGAKNAKFKFKKG
ncbi:leucine-rich repeat protein [Butyrivibrio sp. WCD3002]|uniref:leucine-rich repeat protein n=1 Tax=Butyrivibrio sp. WCD3002 TaxID=1280676 RepID=UPI0004013546|nr:leucine-rich repeat protein [Butyrivibrio sp. WCD3002]